LGRRPTQAQERRTQQKNTGEDPEEKGIMMGKAGRTIRQTRKNSFQGGKRSFHTRRKKEKALLAEFVEEKNPPGLRVVLATR